jgi:hypothetical protein
MLSFPQRFLSFAQNCFCSFWSFSLFVNFLSHSLSLTTFTPSSFQGHESKRARVGKRESICVSSSNISSSVSTKLKALRF